MSADRYEITDNNASIRCQKPGKGPLILYACDRDSSTQKIIAVIRQLRADLAAVSAERDLLRDENAALLAANRDCKLHFDALKGDYDEAAHFARHFIGPALGMTAWREPTEEECERIYSFWISAEGCIGRTPGERMGRIMIAAVRAELGPALGLVEIREPTPDNQLPATRRKGS